MTASVATDSTITLDGQTLAFAAGESVIEVASRHRIHIPHYCWHKRLSVAANCRMCLVEIEKSPKLLPACQTECRQDMVVKTQTTKVQDAQAAVHEFLLLNHPIDCPICDQAGECKLQNYYMTYQHRDSRMHERKVSKAKLVRLGPYVVYNAERCIMCTRCVRFMEEIPKVRQLGIFGRGDRTVIGTVADQQLDNPYSLNTVDVCPVGALTSTVFRFKQRVWNLSHAASLCPGCARGCNVHVDHRSNQVYRLRPRENEAVNQSWLCDEGRLTYNWANEQRLHQALVMPAEATVARPIDAATALTAAQAWLTALTNQRLLVAIDASSTCEEAYLLGRLVLDRCANAVVVLLAKADGEGDTLLRVADKNPNRRGVVLVLQELGFTVWSEQQWLQQTQEPPPDACLCLGEPGNSAAFASHLGPDSNVLLLTWRQSPLIHVAKLVLPTASWLETAGTWLNTDGRAQALQPVLMLSGAAQTAATWLQALLERQLVLNSDAVLAAQAALCATLPSFAALRLNELGGQGQPLPATLSHSTAEAVHG